MSFSKEFLDKVIDSIRFIDLSELEKMVDILVEVRNTGRLFIIGSGGGAGHASHAVCDFRKLCNIDAIAAYDNVSFLSATTNDEGYDMTIIKWLETSKLTKNDCILVFSVGGGNQELGISTNITKALIYSHLSGAKILGIVGRDGGLTKELADATILIHAKDYVTPITEGVQSVVHHLLVEHPRLKINPTKW
jgi:D-sedoheptulose 7-phosphate isomerase